MFCILQLFFRKYRDQMSDSCVSWLCCVNTLPCFHLPFYLCWFFVLSVLLVGWDDIVYIMYIFCQSKTGFSVAA